MIESILALILATTVLVLIPGPNVAFIVANSLRHGFKYGFITVLGTTTGVMLQLSLVVGGMATIIELAAGALTWIKWLGVAYLLWLGIATWREPAGDLTAIQAESEQRTFWRGALLAVVNPKTLLFNAAFLPQFVAGGAHVALQLTIVAAVFISVILVGDVLWALFASCARGLIGRAGQLRSRVTGVFLVGAGAALARQNI